MLKTRLEWELQIKNYVSTLPDRQIYRCIDRIYEGYPSNWLTYGDRLILLLGWQWEMRMGDPEDLELMPPSSERLRELMGGGTWWNAFFSMLYNEYKWREERKERFVSSFFESWEQENETWRSMWDIVREIK